MLNLPPNNKSESFPYKVCNSVNCYFSNECLGDTDDLNLQENHENCLFCAYNYNNLYEMRKFLKYELNRNKPDLKRRLRKSFCYVYMCFIAAAAFLAACLYILFRLNFFGK